MRRDEAEAEDAMQGAYLHAYAHLREFRPGPDRRVGVLTEERTATYDRLRREYLLTEKTSRGTVKSMSSNTTNPITQSSKRTAPPQGRPPMF